jgi:phosphoglycolate phosphatase
VTGDAAAAAALFWSARALVFDLDGTLVDTLPDLTRCLDQALIAEGLPPAGPALVRRSLHGGLEGSVAAALAGHPAAARHAAVLARYRALYDADPAEASRPFAGVVPLLQRLRRRQRPMAICTNKTEATARQLLQRLGLAEGLEVVVGADTCGRRKPDPAPLRLALSMLRTDADQALMVGDSPVDRDVACAAGLRCLIFGGGYGGPGLEGLPRFDDYRELLRAEPLG